MEHEIRLELGDTLAELTAATGAAQRFIDAHDVPPEQAYAVHLVLEEMLTNIIKFAYDDDEPHGIVVCLRADARAITVRFEDEGREFDPSTPRTIPTGDRIEDRPIGGLGLHLVHSMASSVTYARQGGRNVSEIRIDL